VVALKLLPYSSSLVTGTLPDKLAQRPNPDFWIGPIEVPVQTYASAAQLLPFRKEFERSCRGTNGLAAAACVTRALSAAFPDGRPRDEFVAATFDPEKHLREHLAGEPGHCLTRSAILATQLLAVGIPARIAQLLPPDGRGHTLVEVWDEGTGWVLVDPTYGGALGTDRELASAASLLRSPEKTTWYGLGGSPTTLANHGRGLPPEFVANAFRGHLIYPEPWLYLRLGPRSAPWPFRGRFVRVGPWKADLGPLQLLLWVAAPTFGLSSLLCLGLALRSRVFSLSGVRASPGELSRDPQGDRLETHLTANP
jgi:hypothetical protein